MDDTSPEIRRLQDRIFASMTAEQRLALCAEMSAMARDLALDSLRRELPHLDPRELILEYIRRQFGIEVPAARAE